MVAKKEASLPQDFIVLFSLCKSEEYMVKLLETCAS